MTGNIYSGQKKKLNGPGSAKYFFPVELGTLQKLWRAVFDRNYERNINTVLAKRIVSPLKGGYYLQIQDLKFLFLITVCENFKEKQGRMP